MTVEVKTNLLQLHKYLNLKLDHIAIGSYPAKVRGSCMAMSRLLFIFSDSSYNNSFIKDLKTDKLLTMHKNHIYFIPCYHEIDITLDEKLHFVSLRFNLDLFYGFDIFKDYPNCESIKAPSLITEIRQLMNNKNNVKNLCRLNEIIYNLCISLLKDYPGISPKAVTSYQQYETVLDFVQKSGDATTTVAILARMKGMRQDAFSRKFTKDMGVTPKSFIDNILLRKATQMLIPGTTIRTIAEKLNFSSEYYFSRFFKKHTGIPPKLFKKLNSSL